MRASKCACVKRAKISASAGNGSQNSLSAGKTLSLYLALDPAPFENSKYRFEDVSDKKSYAATPMRLRITSERAVRHAKELFRMLAQKLEISEVGCMYTDFHYPYRTDEELIANGLIVPYRTIVKKRG